MGHDDSKVYQLRVRITAEERDLLEPLRLQARPWRNPLRPRARGHRHSSSNRSAADGDDASARTSAPHVERLAELLKREPRQVEESCVEGILDLIERKCEVPLIVMETHLHLKYRGKDDKTELPWKTPTDSTSDGAPSEPQ